MRVDLSGRKTISRELGINHKGRNEIELKQTLNKLPKKIEINFAIVILAQQASDEADPTRMIK